MSRSVFHFSGFRLDRTTLQYQGRTIPLTPKAIDLLFLLVSRAPEILTKEDIFAAVWPNTFVVESSLARNISVIRKALEEKDPQQAFIETIPKRGYRFVATLTAGETPAPPPVATELPSLSSTLPRHGKRKRWAIVGTVAAALAAVAAGWLLWGRTPAAMTGDERLAHHLLAQGTPDAARRALPLFERAVQEHPSSRAYAGLAECLIVLPQLGVRMADGPARALSAAKEAIRLGPDNPSAHAAMGAAYLFVHWDLGKAEAALRRAVKADPGHRTAVYWLSNLLSATGRTEEALRITETALRLDPVSELLEAQHGRIHFYRGDFEKAEPAFLKVLSRSPHYALAHYYLSITYAFLGRFPEAEKHLSEAELQPFLLRNDRAWLQLQQGNRTPAEEIYRQLKEEVQQGRLDHPTLLLPAASLGIFDDAFAALNSAWRERNPDVLNITSDPRFEPLRQDPRFPVIARRMGLLPPNP